MSKPLLIWCNAKFPAAAVEMLKQETAPHQLVFSQAAQVSNLTGGSPDPVLAEADIAFGQPDPMQAMTLANLKWVQLNSAGYTRYDNDAFRAAMKKNGTVVTNSSGVYADPCAQHILAMMLALARQLPEALEEQRSTRAWSILELRAHSRLLTGQTALLVGYGSIVARLAELLAPFEMNLIGFRRKPRGDEKIKTLPLAQLDQAISQADHVINMLPQTAGTDDFFDADRFATMKPSAIYYSIGRGSTTNSTALVEALNSKRLACAYLDVTHIEPLPKDDPLWDAPNCFITPHTAGGHDTEYARLVEHFVANLRRFESGQSLSDRII